MTSIPTANVLVIVDAPNWSHDYKTKSLQRTLGGEYQILKRFQSDVTETDLDSADLIMVYYWLQFERMKNLEAAFMRNRRKLLVGVCSHFELEGAWRESGLARLRQFARSVFAVNLLLYQELQQLLDAPVFYTPNGVVTEFFRPSPESRTSAQPASFRSEERNGFQSKLKARLGSIGNFVKGLLRTAPSDTAGNREIRVGWAGSLSNQTPQQRGFHDLIEPAVRSVEGAQLVVAAREDKWRGPDEMLEFYRSIDIYLCASRTEGTPNPCLEAAACGVPIVTTRVGNMPELIEHCVNGFFVEPDVSDIADKITQLRNDPLLRIRLSQNMLATIETWDWKYQAGNYRNMFEAVLNPQTPRLEIV
jgi:glycosyltransferase involved in cell wall biosynthesis